MFNQNKSIKGKSCTYWCRSSTRSFHFRSVPRTIARFVITSRTCDIGRCYARLLFWKRQRLSLFRSLRFVQPEKVSITSPTPIGCRSRTQSIRFRGVYWTISRFVITSRTCDIGRCYARLLFLEKTKALVILVTSVCSVRESDQDSAGTYWVSKSQTKYSFSRRSADYRELWQYFDDLCTKTWGVVC